VVGNRVWTLKIEQKFEVYMVNNILTSKDLTNWKKLTNSCLTHR